MNIDSNTGEWKVGHYVVSPSLQLLDFVASPLGATAREIIRNAGWTTYALQVPDGQDILGVNLLFQGTRLAEIRFAPTEASQPLSAWSDETEQRRKALHGKPPAQWRAIGKRRAGEHHRWQAKTLAQPQQRKTARLGG